MRVRKAVIIATCTELKSPLKAWSVFWNSCMVIAGSGSLSTMKSKSRSPDGNDFCFSSLHISTSRPEPYGPARDLLRGVLFLSVYLSRQVAGLDRYRLRGHRVGSGMPDDSLRSHARWSLRAVLLDIMPRHAQAAGGIFVLSACVSFWNRAKRSKSPAHFLCLREPKKAGQRNLRVALGAARPQCGRAAPGRALPAPIGAESGSLRLRARTR